MDGNNLTRTVRLVRHLLFSPVDIVPYVTKGPFCKLTPVELGVPWFSWGAIRFLDDFVKAGMRVFEYGAGGSTVFFAGKGANVVSIEDDKSWYEKINSIADERGWGGKITVQYRPYDFGAATNFHESEYLNSIPDGENFDVFVIDGMEGEVKVRPACFALAQRRVGPGGIIVVDDSWRYPEIIDMSQAKRRIRFQGTGPCRPGVTSTDIHFY